MRLLIVALAIVALAGCAENSRAAAVSCGVFAKQCIQLYSGGNIVMNIKDPSSITQIGQDPRSGVGWIDANGTASVWTGDYLIRTKRQ